MNAIIGNFECKMRMPTMDLADVAYDLFLVNGNSEENLSVKPGETVRLRVIDGSASTFFHLSYAGDPLNILALAWEAGWQGTDDTEWEADYTYGRYFNRFTNLFAGVNAEGVDSTRKEERAIVGIRYLLPGNFQSQAWIDHKGEARFMLERELMLTPRLGIFGEVEYDTQDRWASHAGMSYTLSQYLSTTALWDSEYGVGAGLTFKF